MAGFFVRPSFDGSYDFQPYEAGIFRQWYMASGWQERAKELFDCAAEVDAAIRQGGKNP
jgi:hypothetical protein